LSSVPLGRGFYVAQVFRKVTKPIGKIVDIKNYAVVPRTNYRPVGNVVRANLIIPTAKELNDLENILE